MDGYKPGITRKDIDAMKREHSSRRVHEAGEATKKKMDMARKMKRLPVKDNNTKRLHVKDES